MYGLVSFCEVRKTKLKCITFTADWTELIIATALLSLVLLLDSISLNYVVHLVCFKFTQYWYYWIKNTQCTPETLRQQSGLQEWILWQIDHTAKMKFYSKIFRMRMFCVIFHIVNLMSMFNSLWEFKKTMEFINRNIKWVSPWGNAHHLLHQRS